jgi:hypothetical protein
MRGQFFLFTKKPVIFYGKRKKKGKSISFSALKRSSLSLLQGVGTQFSELLRGILIFQRAGILRDRKVYYLIYRFWRRA